MVKISNLKKGNTLMNNYKLKKISQKQKKLEYDMEYEKYIYEGLKKAEEEIANGSKSYSEEEFWSEMRRCYGIDI